MSETGALDRSRSATKDLVSVIIIFLNEERHLAEAVQSVVAQDHVNWELLLVDDGSSDRSPEIARDFAAQDPRITCLAHPGGANRGMSASRNLGLAHARGEYVTFLDGDDVYLPSRLSSHVAILAANPSVAMVVSDHLRWFSEYTAARTPAEAVYARSFLAVGDQVWKPPIGLMVTMGVPYLALGICNVTVRREVAHEVGGFENQFTALFEDQAFTSKVLARYRVYVLQGYLARYRHHAGSWTRRVKESGAHGKVPHADTTRFLGWLLEHLHTNAIADPLLLQLIQSRAAAASRTPNALQQVLMRMSAAFKRYLRVIVPERWYVRLLVLDYERDQRAARADYARLGDALSHRAVHDALESDRA
jgi:glycosyltransferase involved in cell wall biosynthesis